MSCHLQQAIGEVLHEVVFEICQNSGTRRPAWYSRNRVYVIFMWLYNISSAAATVEVYVPVCPVDLYAG